MSTRRSRPVDLQSVRRDVFEGRVPPADGELAPVGLDGEARDLGEDDREVRLLESVTDGDSVDTHDGHRSNPLAEACSTDAAFRLLADRTRRVLFSVLGGGDDRVRLDDLAERVAAWKSDKPVTEVTADERETAKIELHHKHLPMLADAGVLEYDPETMKLSERDRPVAVAEWLVACPALETFETASGA